MTEDEKFGFPQDLTIHEIELLTKVLEALRDELKDGKQKKLLRAMNADSARKQMIMLKQAEGLDMASSLVLDRIESLEQRYFENKKEEQDEQSKM